MPYSGNLHSKSVENHVFVIHDKKLNDRVIASFSLKGFEEFIKKPFAKQQEGVNSTATNPVEYVNETTEGTYKKFQEGVGYQEEQVSLSELISWINTDSQTAGGVDKQHATDPDDDGNKLQDIIESLDSEVVFGKLYVIYMILVLVVMIEPC